MNVDEREGETQEIPSAGPVTLSPKRLHRAAVLRALSEGGSASRGDLAMRTGLSAATVSRIVDELQKARLLTVAGTSTNRALGRRSEVLKLNPRGGRMLGVHLGGHSNDVGLSDLAGNIYAEEHLPVLGQQHHIEDVLEAIGAAIERLLAADSRTEPLLGIGVSTGGVIDGPTGRLVAHGQYSWRNFPLKDWFARRFGRYTAVGNSFQGLAWFEALFSGIERHNSLLFVNCSTIIGAGFATPNNLTGPTTLSSGQLGHSRTGTGDAMCTCGRRGCLQATASDPALCARAAEVFGPVEGSWTIHRLGQMARDGDDRAVKLFADRAHMVAPAIAVLVNSLAPSVLALGHNHHPFAEEEHRVLAGIVEEELYPPLRSRVTIRPVSEPDPKRGVESGLAIILREFYSPALELDRGARGRLIPVLRLETDLTSGEGQDPGSR